MLTHLATTDCFLTQPHPALECGIVAAWWQSLEAADSAVRRQHDGGQPEWNDQERV